MKIFSLLIGGIISQRVDEKCVRALQKAQKENQIDGGAWICDNIYQPNNSYSCTGTCDDGSELNARISVECPRNIWQNPVIEKNFVFTPSCSSLARSSRTSTKCSDFIDIAVEGGFIKKTGDWKGKVIFYNLFCGETLETAVLKEPKHKFQCKTKRPFLKALNGANKNACVPPKPKVKHCLDEETLKEIHDIGDGTWSCNGRTRRSTCTAMCNHPHASANLVVKCIRGNVLSIWSGTKGSKCELPVVDETFLQPLKAMPELKSCDGTTHGVGEMPWVEELNITTINGDDVTCRASPINTNWLMTSASCCHKAAEIKRSTDGTNHAEKHIHSFWNDRTDGTLRNHDFCLVKYETPHNIPVPCLGKEQPPLGAACWAFGENYGAAAVNYLGADYCQVKSAVKTENAELCVGIRDDNQNFMVDILPAKLVRGTPLICDIDGTAVLYGTGSIVDDCNSLENFPAIFTDLSEASDWMHTIL